MRNFLNKLQHSSDFWFLLATSVVFFLFRLPSFFEPYWYGDEGVYEVLGFGMRHGRLLYQGVWDNKPPLLYIIYALFDGNQPYVRFFSFLVGLLAVYLFFLLSKLLFEKKKTFYVATGLFALLLGLPLLEGNIANAENFMILPAVASVYFIVKTIKNKQFSLLSLFLSGLLLGISFLIKVVAVFDFASIFLLLGFVAFALNKKTIGKLIAQWLLMVVGFLLPLIMTVGFFAYKGILKTFIQSAFLSNVGYVGYGNQFIIPQGFLILKLLFLVIIFSVVFFKRKSLSLTQLLLYVWLPFSVFNAFFSQRPYTHYMLVLIAPLMLFVGLLFEKKLRILHGVVVIAVVILLATNFWFYGKVIWYYQNFTQLLTNQKTVAQYQSFFDKGVPRDYAVADFLRANLQPNQTAFLWTNSAQIYYLTHLLPPGRFTVAYHIVLNPDTLSETALALSNEKPHFIVILPNASNFPFKMRDYHFRLNIGDAAIYERIF